MLEQEPPAFGLGQRAGQGQPDPVAGRSRPVLGRVADQHIHDLVTAAIEARTGSRSPSTLTRRAARRRPAAHASRARPSGTPNLTHDMHTGSIHRADSFLQRLCRRLLTASAPRGGVLLIVTFDEGTSHRGIHGQRGHGHIATIVVGPGIPVGGRDPTRYDHYALLRSLEQRLGPPPLRHAADRETMTIPAVAGPSATHATRNSR